MLHTGTVCSAKQALSTTTSTKATITHRPGLLSPHGHLEHTWPIITEQESKAWLKRANVYLVRESIRDDSLWANSSAGIQTSGGAVLSALFQLAKIGVKAFICRVLIQGSGRCAVCVGYWQLLRQRLCSTCPAVPAILLHQKGIHSSLVSPFSSPKAKIACEPA